MPYAKSLAIEKKKVRENAVVAATAATAATAAVVATPVSSKLTESQKTAAQTAKSGVRIAHVPQVVGKQVFLNEFEKRKKDLLR